MALLRVVSAAVALAAASLLPGFVRAQDVIPGPPSIVMSFDASGEEGKVVGTVTAPGKDSSGKELSADVRMDISVTRSCYALGESVIVATFTDLAPNAKVDFVDDKEPAWQYGNEYMYNPVASIDGRTGSQGYGSMSPGVKFAFSDTEVKAEPKEVDGGFKVEVTAKVPSQTVGSRPEDLTFEMTALELHRVTSTSWPYTMELIDAKENPTKGESYLLVDNNPKLNAENIYVVKCLSKFGFAEIQLNSFVGYDVPAAPYPVLAEAYDGGCKITWTAPTSGLNYGQINADDTFYNIYRCWGRNPDERVRIASEVKETEYVDYGADMEFPRAVRYEVEAANSVGVGGSNYSSYDYDIVIGPAEQLPFIETLDGGADHVWMFGSTVYYTNFSLSTVARYGDAEPVLPAAGNGLAYADFTVYGASPKAVCSMTSYKIDVSKATAPVLSLQTYRIPDCDVMVYVDVSVNGGEFVEVDEISVGQTGETGWVKSEFPLGELTAGASTVAVRLRAKYTEKPAAAIIDDIKLINYPSVGNIDVVYDSGACTATLSWKDPSDEYTGPAKFEGFVNGVSQGKVSSPWVFEAPEYKTVYSVAVKAVYDGVEAAMSNPVAVSVPRPAFSEFTVDDHLFFIVSDSPDVHQVVIKKYLGGEELYKTPELVTFDDVKYEVVGIGMEAYKGNTNLVSVTIANGITEVGVSAFMDCTSLRAVSIGTGLISIKTGAFKGCSSLSSVIFISKTVPDVALDAFEGIKAGCKGNCPDGTVEAYAAVEGLAPIDFGLLGVAGIAADDVVEVEYFDLYGRKLAAPVRGRTVIVRATCTDGTVKTEKCRF